MISRRKAFAGLVAACFCSCVGPLLAQPRQPTIFEMLDVDDSGRIELDEARIAAATLFDELDGDGDRMLDARELGGRLSTKELAAWDPDADGTLTKVDYLAAVEQRFKAAILIRMACLAQKN